MLSICPNINLGISAGSIYNFNVEAYEKLELFEAWLVNAMRKEPLLHADEIEVNILVRNAYC